MGRRVREKVREEVKNKVKARENEGEGEKMREHWLCHRITTKKDGREETVEI
jgi:hypothetical protein